MSAQFPVTVLKCLSVRQPWASLIADGRKTVELRSRRTHYRGPVVICSSSRPWKGEHGYEVGPMGVTLCIAYLVDCVEATQEHTGRACIEPRGGYAWILENVRPVAPTPVKGRLGLFDAPPEVVTAAMAA